MQRIKELDGVRGIAIFLVLLWHYIFCQVGSTILESNIGFLFKYLSLTWSGVDLFFVLSGFLIVGILLDARGAKTYFLTFYIRRALRILPLYYVMFFLLILLPKYISNDWLFSRNISLWNYLTFTQNFYMIKEGFGANWMGITWSLAVEEQFYIILPLMVWALPRKKLTYVFLGLICLAPIFRLVLSDFGGYVLPFARADSILMGGILAIIYRTPRIKDELVENYPYLFFIFIIFLIGVIVLTLYLPAIGNAFVHLWLAVFYSLFLVICTLRPGKLTDLLISNRFFVWLGLRSYGIYLFHQPVSSLLHQYLNGNVIPRFSDIREFFVTVFALVITFILAEVSFRFFESVFLSWGRQFRYEAQTDPGSLRIL